MNGHTHTHSEAGCGDPHLLPWEWVRLLLDAFGRQLLHMGSVVFVCVCECVRGQKVRGRGLRMGVGRTVSWQMTSLVPSTRGHTVIYCIRA